jgi:hypothetical protein
MLTDRKGAAQMLGIGRAPARLNRRPIELVEGFVAASRKRFDLAGK